MLCNPPIPFEVGAIRHAIGDLAANATPYVRLGALRLMARILGMDRPTPPPLFSGRSTEEVKRALDNVTGILEEIKSGGDEESAEEEDDPL
ncbi:MAG: hypothetical protein OXS30_08485 [Chloroflexota bacterium]|nr:hypothetical protein [Chloroflexota bacterium]